MYFIQPVGLLLYGHSKVVRMLVQPVGLRNDLFCRRLRIAKTNLLWPVRRSTREIIGYGQGEFVVACAAQHPGEHQVWPHLWTSNEFRMFAQPDGLLVELERD